MHYHSWTPYMYCFKNCLCPIVAPPYHRACNRFLYGLNWRLSSITYFFQKMVLLVEALNIILSGIWSLWIVSGLKVNLQRCGSIAVTWGMIPTIFSKLQGWRKILNLIFSLHHDDNMPLSLKCIASTSDAIFWCGTLAPLYPVVQPIKDVFARMDTTVLHLQCIFISLRLCKCHFLAPSGKFHHTSWW